MCASVCCTQQTCLLVGKLSCVLRALCRQGAICLRGIAELGDASRQASRCWWGGDHLWCVVFSASAACPERPTKKAKFTAHAVVFCKDMSACLDWLLIPSWARRVGPGVVGWGVPCHPVSHHGGVLGGVAVWEQHTCTGSDATPVDRIASYTGSYSTWDIRDAFHASAQQHVAHSHWCMPLWLVSWVAGRRSAEHFLVICWALWVADTYMLACMLQYCVQHVLRLVQHASSFLRQLSALVGGTACTSACAPATGGTLCARCGCTVGVCAARSGWCAHCRCAHQGTVGLAGHGQSMKRHGVPSGVRC
jgi:hypothetical protein